MIQQRSIGIFTVSLDTDVSLTRIRRIVVNYDGQFNFLYPLDI